MKNQGFRLSSPEVARTLFQAGLWAVTGRLFPLDGAGIPQGNSEQFREALMARAIREKMMPMLDAFSRIHDLGLGDSTSRLTEVFGIISREHYSHLRPALDSLAQRGIPVALIKGGHLDLAVYQKKYPRVMGDIDILVRPPDTQAVKDVFKDLGFIQGVLNSARIEIEPLSDQERSQIEEDGIELAEFSKLISVPDLITFKGVISHHLAYWRMVPLHDTFYLVAGYDVHTHLSRDMELVDVWSDLQMIDFPEVGQCLAQSFTDLAWYLAVRFYHELHINNAFVMRSFLDVLLVVHRHHGSIDWDRILYISEKYKLHPSLFYTFWRAQEILGGVIPEKLIRSLDPSSPGADRGHDWGDFIPKMLGDIQILPLLDRA